MEWTRNFLYASALFFSLGFLIQIGQADPVVFEIDNTQSQLATSGVFVGATAIAQGAGALTTSYSGFINANLSNTNIQFTGGSFIIAKTNGVWQPAVGGGSGSAPADYGPEATVTIVFPVTVYGAMRNIVFDMTSPLLAVTNGGFNGTNLVFSFATNTAALDYNYSVSSGSKALNGYSTNTVATAGTLTTNGTVRKVVIQISTQFVFSLLSSDDTKVLLAGQLVATNTVVVPAPVIESVTVSNQNVMVTAENATSQSQLQVSTNLTAWTTAGFTTATNDLGWIIFTTPTIGSHAFFRVQQ